MTSKDRNEAKKRTEMLVALREQHREGVKEAQALLKEQQTRRKVLQQTLRSGPQTIPQLAAAIGFPAQDVLWHITAMKKYGLIEEKGMDEDETYYLYGLTKEARP
jgi:predicted transcriptional regulator